ncbi:hypothetical protein GGI43DRAFT_409470 [Trichoderma evansii]
MIYISVLFLFFVILLVHVLRTRSRNCRFITLNAMLAPISFFLSFFPSSWCACPAMVTAGSSNSAYSHLPFCQFLPSAHDVHLA